MKNFWRTDSVCFLRFATYQTSFFLCGVENPGISLRSQILYRSQVRHFAGLQWDSLLEQCIAMQQKKHATSTLAVGVPAWQTLRIGGNWYLCGRSLGVGMSLLKTEGGSGSCFSSHRIHGKGTFNQKLGKWSYLTDIFGMGWNHTN